MVVLSTLRDVVHRASLSEPHLALAGRGRPAGECRQRSPRRAGVQGLAESSQSVPRCRVPAISNRHEKGKLL